jgi:hypothetical protein
MSKEKKPLVLVVTWEELAEAFRSWHKAAAENPEKFEPWKVDDDSGEASADYLIETVRKNRKKS